MSDIFDEIKQSFDDKRNNKILGRVTVGLFALGIILISYLGMASWYDSRKHEEIQKDGVELIQSVNSINYAKLKDKNNPDEKNALQDRNKKNIEKLEKLAEKGTSAYSVLANFYLASLALIDGNHNKAIYYYQRAAKNSDSDTIKEYSRLVELNAKLQFNSGSPETVNEKLDEYFKPYIKDNKIEHEISHEKVFSRAMALVAIAMKDSAGDLDKANPYLGVLKQSDSPNENVQFISDILSQYLMQKQK